MNKQFEQMSTPAKRAAAAGDVRVSIWSQGKRLRRLDTKESLRSGMASLERYAGLQAAGAALRGAA